MRSTLLSIIAFTFVGCGGGDSETDSISDSASDSLMESSSSWGPMKVIKKCRRNKCDAFSSKVDGYLREVLTDSNDNIYAVVTSDGFPHGVIASFLGLNNVVVSKFDSTGEWLWTRVYGSGYTDEVTDAVMLGSEIVFSAFSGGDFTTNPTCCGAIRAFVVNIDLEGDINWTSSLGPDLGSTTYVSRLLVDAGDIYFVGSSSADLDGGGHLGGGDAYVAKMSSAGSLMAVRSFGTSEFDHGYDLAKKPSGEIVASMVSSVGTSGTTYQISDHSFNDLLSLQSSTNTQALTSGVQYNRVVSKRILVERETFDVGGNRYVASVSGAVATITKYNSSAVQLWQSVFDFSGETPAVTYLDLGGLSVSPNGNIIFGLTTDYATARDSNGLMMPSYISILSPDGQVLNGINW